MLERDVAPGIHRLCIAHTNVYLVEHEGRVLVVDAGLPSFWKPLLRALDELGHGPEQVDAVVLTHAHFDHVGVARRARTAWRVPVWVHADDAHLAAHPYSYRPERARLLYPLAHPGGLKPLADMAVAGALVVRGVSDTSVLTPSTLITGEPIVIPTPGHTAGHIALHFPERDALIVGDAIVTLDPYTGGTGPQIVARAATADSPEALRSLEALAATNATTVLTGHGDPWRKGIRSAVAAARSRGAH
ncbi:MBL fold metallo-hydrolase [Labedella endophytica]|jgi:glyoxylase-like metal-dependent hydrolase (beta-lactamase superfamily II)|uniref:MBL fold metallo-hydrolase n=1 Tax=Labedella endophytica TaxID=1523160 RepID=A0A3S0X6Z9_9MICO|nr:MBL fold metallo-hydrolase [Labedella endophytica]RUR00791.1 MBL fold metallo-hydrolase [Labedella endophytica]